MSLRKKAITLASAVMLAAAIEPTRAHAEEKWDPIANEHGELSKEDGIEFSKRLAITNAIAGLGSAGDLDKNFALSFGIGEANEEIAVAGSASFKIRESMNIKIAVGTDAEFDIHRASVGFTVNF